MKKLILSVILTTVLASLAACAGKTSDSGMAADDFSVAAFADEKSGIGIVHDFSVHNGQLLLIGDTGDARVQERVTKALVFDLDGNLLSESVLRESGSLLGNIDKHGRIWLFCSGSDALSYTLACYDSDGKYIKSVPLNTFAEQSYQFSAFKVEIDAREYGEGRSVEGEVLYIQAGKDLITFDQHGSKLDISYRLPLLDTLDYISIFRHYDGRVILYERHNEWMNGDERLRDINPIYKIKKPDEHLDDEELDLWDLGYGGVTQITDKNVTVQLSQEIGGDLYFKAGFAEDELFVLSPQGAYRYNLQYGVLEQIMDWVSSGVDNGNASMYKHTAFSDNAVFCLSYMPPESGGLSAGGSVSIIKLERKMATAKDDDAEPRKTVTISSLYTGPEITRAMILFNRDNPDYRVELLKTYGEGHHFFYDADAINAFNLDLITGNTPDIIFFASHTPTDIYTSKNIFADLYGFIDNDPDICRADYLENILRLLETDGKLYTGTAAFYINTLIGKAADFGGKEYLTWDDYENFLADKPSDFLPMADPLGATTKEGFLSLMLKTKINDFVDFQSGTCSFAVPEFIRLLEATKNYPLAREDYRGDIDFSESEPPLLWMDNFIGFSWGFYMGVLKSFFGEEITYYGFPVSEEGQNGAGCAPTGYFAIFENAAEKDGAWEFIKYFLTDFQETAADGVSSSLIGLPVKISVLERLAKDAQEPEEYGPSIDMPTDNDIRKVFGLINSLRYLDVTDWNISTIINEEAQAYYAGQKSAADVAALVQNRVSIYLKEIN